MKWKMQLQQVIDYAEMHLERSDDPLDSNEIANIAGCSYSFFLKVFSYINGISFSDYIRNRRLTLAGYDLKNTTIKVADVSYKYHYDSPTSFTKAFQMFHGVTPRNAKNEYVNLRIYPRMQLVDKQEFSWSLISKPSMRLVGKKFRVPNEYRQKTKYIAEYWKQSFRNGMFTRLLELNQDPIKGVYCLNCSENKTETEREYMISVKNNGDFNDLDVCEIPATTWAVFDCYGIEPDTTEKCWNYINEEYLATHPIKCQKLPMIEWYSDGNAFSEDFHSQIWIPIDEEI